AARPGDSAHEAGLFHPHAGAWGNLNRARRDRGHLDRDRCGVLGGVCLVGGVGGGVLGLGFVVCGVGVVVWLLVCVLVVCSLPGVLWCCVFCFQGFGFPVGVGGEA
ncbi:hypothetical protein, partial [Pseudomonas syringae group genomosp. 7]|uniref:hypothetical protein n=1 Tax=Pseudomonas syringae group genomosp. 7 TaxID=251699 RepID=UPI00376F719C